MAIEFRCTQCNRLLRTEDDSVGKQARCPDCGTVQMVPAAEMGVPPPPPPEADFRGPPLPPGETPNPFQSPRDYVPGPAVSPEPLRPYALSRVAGPATSLLIVGALGLIFSALGAMGGLRAARLPAAQMPPRLMVPANLVAAVLAVIVILGAIKMKNLESYGLAMAAAIIALVPCTSPCCLLGLPFGIWALVVLTDPGVRSAFRS